MPLILMTLLLCVLFFALCYLGTGTKEKNIKHLNSYPNAIVDKMVDRFPELGKMKIPSAGAAFLSNFVVFGIVLLIAGYFVRSRDFGINFLRVLIMGEVLNLFDLLVIDLLWWRNSPRIRFAEIKASPAEYRDASKHVGSFLRGVLLFLAVAVADGFLITLIG